MFLSNIPYWTGIHFQTNELFFRGSYYDEADYAVHVSMMQAGRMGDWTYQMRFTSEEHQPAFIRIFYLFLGHVSKWTNIEIDTTFHIARWIFGLLALLSIYKLCLKLFPYENIALFAFVLSSLGAGLGWLQLLMGASMKPISPIDFWLIDAYVFFSISLFPAFSFSITLMTHAIGTYLDFLDQPDIKSVFAICTIAIVIQMINPIAFAVIDISFLVTTILHWHKFKKISKTSVLALFFIVTSQIPLFIYNFLILTRDPIWSQFTLQNETLSPPIKFYFWGFFPFLIFAIWGGIKSIHERDPKFISMTTWAVSGFALAYLPVLIQRRFLLGITVPLGILATYGLNDLLQKLSIKYPAYTERKNLVYLGYVLLASVSSIYLVLGSSLFLRTLPKDKFYPKDLENALIWLDNNAEPNEFVLGAVQTSQITSQRTKLRTYTGHEMETLNFKEKLTLVENFYLNSEYEGWIRESPIHWVIYGPYERKLSLSFTPSKELVLAYQNSTVNIYMIKH